jgi:hypothetical protein
VRCPPPSRRRPCPYIHPPAPPCTGSCLRRLRDQRQPEPRGAGPNRRDVRANRPRLRPRAPRSDALVRHGQLEHGPAEYVTVPIHSPVTCKCNRGTGHLVSQALLASHVHMMRPRIAFAGKACLHVTDTPPVRTPCSRQGAQGCRARPAACPQRDDRGPVPVRRLYVNGCLVGSTMHITI